MVYPFWALLKVKEENFIYIIMQIWNRHELHQYLDNISFGINKKEDALHS